MKICVDCGDDFPNTLVIDGKKHRIDSRRRCLKCLPFKSNIRASRHGMTSDEWDEYQRQRKNQKATNYKIRNPELDSFRVLECRRNKKLALIEYKGGACQRCGYNKKIARAYHFHHRDANLKGFGVSERMNWNLDKLKLEADNCELLCSRCHSEMHHEQDMAERTAMMLRLGLLVC